MKQLLTGLILLFTFSALAQEFDIRSFAADPSDLSARKEGRRTVNDEPCALVKVVTNIRGMQFESNIGIVDVVHKEDGYWVYVAPRERNLKLMAPGYLSKEVDLPEPAKELVVYQLIAASSGSAFSTHSELIDLTFMLNEEQVLVRHDGGAPVSSPGRTLLFSLPRGKQQFAFMKSGFRTYTIEVDVQKEELIQIELEPGASEQGFNLNGFLVISSEPSGAEVFLNGQRVGTTPYQGKQAPGAYDLSLRKHLYYTHREELVISDRATVRLPKITLAPQYGYIQVKTDPSDAEVMIDGQPVGVSPIIKRKWASGNYTLSARKDLYHDANENFTLADNQTMQFDLRLDPAHGSISIKTEPAGAEIYLDDILQGKSPLTKTELRSRTYQLRLEKDLHAPFQTTIQIQDGEKNERFFALAAHYGNLEVSSPGSTLFIDGEMVGENEVKTQISPGSHMVEARKHGHDADRREVYILVGETEKIALAPKMRTGTLSIITEPFAANGAEIWLNGNRTKHTSPAILELDEGTHEILVKKDGYGPLRKNVNIINGQEKELKLEMTTGHEIEITSVPSNATLRINGKKVGTTPLTYNFTYGSNKIIFQYGKHKHTEKIKIETHTNQKLEHVFTLPVKIETKPKGIEVAQNGIPIGSTPMVIVLPTGNQTLHFSKKPGKRKIVPPAEKDLEIHPDSTKIFDFDLIDYYEMGEHFLEKKRYRKARRQYKKYLAGDSSEYWKRERANIKIKTCTIGIKQRMGGVVGVVLLTGAVTAFTLVVMNDRDDL